MCPFGSLLVFLSLAAVPGWIIIHEDLFSLPVPIAVMQPAECLLHIPYKIDLEVEGCTPPIWWGTVVRPKELEVCPRKIMNRPDLTFWHDFPGLVLEKQGQDRIIAFYDDLVPVADLAPWGSMPVWEVLVVGVIETGRLFEYLYTGSKRPPDASFSRADATVSERSLNPAAKETTSLVRSFNVLLCASLGVL